MYTMNFLMWYERVWLKMDLDPLQPFLSCCLFYHKLSHSFTFFLSLVLFFVNRKMKFGHVWLKIDLDPLQPFLSCCLFYHKLSHSFTFFLSLVLFFVNRKIRGAAGENPNPIENVCPFSSQKRKKNPSILRSSVTVSQKE